MFDGALRILTRVYRRVLQLHVCSQRNFKVLLYDDSLIMAAKISRDKGWTCGVLG